MENAADALKIAFAIFVFVLAITITFSIISQAKSTADVVLYHSDKTNFYEHVDSKENNRTVSVTEVISTLYRYYKESISVTVNLGEQGETRTFDLSNASSNISTIEEELEEYIKNNLLDENIVGTDVKFEEEFVEVPISGIYETGEDDTQITLSSGGKKVYVTYTLQQ